MKTKNKALAVLEIAIVLCSVFLIALPAIAADQKQETQKVTASEFTTTASEADFILEIYGNANEDDCIDMRDYTHTARIICWLEEETDLADANYDGRISVADMTQIGLIILGRESELTIIDSADRIVTVQKPVERIADLNGYNCEVLRTLDAKDRLVGVGESTKKKKTFFPEISELPSLGSYYEVDIEMMLSLEPDVVILFGTNQLTNLEEKLEGTGIEVLCFYFYNYEILTEEVAKLGYMVDRRDEAEEFTDFYEAVIDSIKSTTEGIPEDEKPRVYREAFWEDYLTINKYATAHKYIEIAGGINIAADLSSGAQYEGYPTVSAEWIIEQDPDIIIKGSCSPPYGCTGYEFDDDSGAKELREKIVNRPGFGTIDAVEEGKVYIDDTSLAGFLTIAYFAKVFHLDLFEDLDPQAIHQEYLDRFQRIDYDLDEHGVFWYPLLE